MHPFVENIKAGYQSDFSLVTKYLQGTEPELCREAKEQEQLPQVDIQSRQKVLNTYLSFSKQLKTETER